MLLARVYGSAKVKKENMMFDLELQRRIREKKNTVGADAGAGGGEAEWEVCEELYRYVLRHAHGPGGGAAVSRHDAAGRGGGKAARGGAAGRSVSACTG